MRIVFFLLLFINLIFAAYIQWDPGAGSRVQLAAEFHPEKIRPLSALPESAASASITSAPVTPAPCHFCAHQFGTRYTCTCHCCAGPASPCRCYT